MVTCTLAVLCGDSWSSLSLGPRVRICLRAQPIIGPINIFFAVIGAVLIVIASFGLAGAFKRKKALLWVHTISVLMLMAALAYGVQYAFNKSQDATNIANDASGSSWSQPRTTDQLASDLRSFYKG